MSDTITGTVEPPKPLPPRPEMYALIALDAQTWRVADWSSNRRLIENRQSRTPNSVLVIIPGAKP